MTASARDTDKAGLRASLRASRATLQASDREDQSDGLRRVVVQYLSDRYRPAGRPDAPLPTVAAYLGVDPEPATERLVGELHRLGFGVVVPVCEPAHRLSWVRWVPGVALQRSVRAPVQEPVGPRLAFDDVPDVGLILVPALGVDRTGNRIGQGGGYYDRFLADRPLDGPGAVPRLGMVYRTEVLPAGAVPSEPYDQPLGGAFTPDGLLRFGTRDRAV